MTLTQELLRLRQLYILDWDTACSEMLLKTVKAHADAVGAPTEFIFFPVLTVTASFMGINAQMCLNSEWREPAVVWHVEDCCFEAITSCC